MNDLTKAERFKIGFLKQAARMGLTPADFADAMSKDAGFGDTALKAFAGLPTLAKYLISVGAIGLPFLGGMAVGGAGRAASQVDDPDVEEAKSEELADTYRRLTQDVRQRTNQQFALQ